MFEAQEMLSFLCESHDVFRILLMMLLLLLFLTTVEDFKELEVVVAKEGESSRTDLSDLVSPLFMNVDEVFL